MPKILPASRRSGVARLRRAIFASLATALIVTTGCQPPTPDPQADTATRALSTSPELEDQSAGLGERLQAVSAASERVVWVGGLGGSWARTEDGGRSWQAGSFEDQELQFRDVFAVSSEVAYLLSSGTSASSRVYKTIDGGDSWRLVHQAAHPQSFWDCFDFWDAERGLLFGDSVAGRLELWRTLDGGDSWQRLEDAPPALAGEGGFAASGTCLRVHGSEGAVVVTGAGPRSRYLATEDGGESWSELTLPLPAGPASGAMSVAILPATSETGGGAAILVFGGDLEDAEGLHPAVAESWDEGRSFRLAPRPDFPGAIYGSAASPRAVVAVGPRGAAIRFDSEHGWQDLSGESHWSVELVGDVGWMVGPEGRITKIRFAE